MRINNRGVKLNIRHLCYRSLMKVTSVRLEGSFHLPLQMIKTRSSCLSISRDDGSLDKGDILNFHHHFVVFFFIGWFFFDTSSSLKPHNILM